MWPTTLPQVLLLFTYAASMQDGAVRTAMDAGPDFVRPRFTRVTEYKAGSMNMTSAQLAIFRTFYQTTLLNGSQWFDWLHPETGAAAEFRFMAPPTWRKKAGDTWEVEMSFEVL